MARSTSPRRRASAHCDGTVNDSSYFPASGPSVNPHTKGAVFRYSTIEIRSLRIATLNPCPYGPLNQYNTREPVPFRVSKSESFAEFSHFGGTNLVSDGFSLPVPGS